jgi:DNA-binding LytR/AlgR family response regulator
MVLAISFFPLFFVALAINNYPMAIRAAIVEDNEEAFRSLEALLKRYEKEKGLPIAISFFPDAEKLLNDYHPDYDVIFMDINLPYLSGIDAAKKLRVFDQDVILVFVTDLAQYAIRGYEVHAFDYIVKPLAYGQLAQKLDKIIRLAEEKDKESKITIKSEDGVIVTSVSSLRYVEVSNHVLTYHVDARTYSAFGSLKDIEKKLPARIFSRCNHCYLVNLKFVSGLDSEYVLVGTDKLKISRPKKKAFINDFTAYLGRHL